MAAYGNKYKEVQTHQDDWENPMSTLSEHGVQGYVVRTRRIVEVRHSYDNGLLNDYKVHDEWDNHSPRKVHEFFDKVHSEASRPTLLSPPNWSTRPNWTSEDHDSPKYRDGSPPRDKFRGLNLQESSPYSYNKDGYDKPSLDSPKSGRFKDYGANNKWDSPPRSTWRDHDDYDTNRGAIPYSYNKDDDDKPKFNGGYKASNPALSQATNDIGNAMKILEEGIKPLASPTYAPQSHFPTSYSTAQRKESYPERSQGANLMASHPSHYPSTEREERYPEPTKGMKPVFSPGYTQQPHSPTSRTTPQWKESYPETTHGAKPVFSPGYTQQPHSPTSNLAPSQRKESYPETRHGAKPLFSPAYTQQPHSPTSNLAPSQRKESYPETEHGAKPLFSPVYTPQSHSPTSSPRPQRKENYPETTQGAKPLFTPQSHSPTSNPQHQRKESYPEAAHNVKPQVSPQQPAESYPNKNKGWKSLFSPASKQQPNPPTLQPTPQMKESYSDHDTHGRNPYFEPSSPEKEHYNPEMKDHNYDNNWKSVTSPYDTQKPRYGASVPLKEAIDSSEAKKKYSNMKPASPVQKKYQGIIDSREAVKKYNGAFVP